MTAAITTARPGVRLGTGARATLLTLLPPTLVAAALRAPFIGAGIGPDEGGWAYVAREWARGGHLYGNAWVDRPQGLMLVYRALLAIADRPWIIRLGAVAAGAAITLLVGMIAWLSWSRNAALAAAWIYAVVGVGPRTQGFTFNGELAAAVPAAAAVAAALAWRRTCRPAWLLVAGLLGGLGILMKQSGFDGLIVALFVAAVAAAPAIRRLARVAIVAAGAAIPLAASAVHGLALGWNSYWNAVVGYRSGQDLAGRAAARPHLLLSSLDQVKLDLALPSCLALAGAAVCVRGRRNLVAAVWLLAAFAGFNTGGLYWPHYYIQLVPPLALLGGIAVAAVLARSRLTAVALAAGVTVPVLITLVHWAATPLPARGRYLPPEGSYRRDQVLAAFVARHSSSRDTIYVLDSEADIYFLADRRSACRYVWSHPLHEVPGALDGLRHTLRGPARPKLVVELKRPEVVDPSGQLASILARRYRLLAHVSSRLSPVLIRRDRRT